MRTQNVPTEAIRGSSIPVLELRDVDVSFGEVHALRGVSMHVHSGERVALIGPSGSGKSTLLALCNATVVPTRGEVQFSGRRVEDRDAWRREDGARIATIHQQLHLSGQLRVVHNVNAGRLGSWSTWRAITSLLRPREVDAVRAVLDRVGIADKLYERTDRLSGGELQRVAIARALNQDPLLMLADEPTASLDPARAAEIMVLLGRLAASEGRALIVSQHDINLALATCDRVVALRAGEIRLDAPVSEVDPDFVGALYRIGESA